MLRFVKCHLIIVLVYEIVLKKEHHDTVRDCSLFMPKGGRCLEWGGGVKFSKSMKEGGCFFKIRIRGKLLETVVSTLV